MFLLIRYTRHLVTKLWKLDKLFNPLNYNWASNSKLWQLSISLWTQKFIKFKTCNWKWLALACLGSESVQCELLDVDSERWCSLAVQFSLGIAEHRRTPSGITRHHRLVQGDHLYVVPIIAHRVDHIGPLRFFGAGGLFHLHSRIFKVHYSSPFFLIEDFVKKYYRSSLFR